MKLVSVAEMKNVEQHAHALGMSYDQMMENAGRGVAGVVLSRFNAMGRNVLGLIGSGNNGGDTLIALIHLSQAGWKARAYLVGNRNRKDPLVQQLLDAGGEAYHIKDDPLHDDLERWLSEASVLLDGILGTGIKLPLKPDIVEVLNIVRQRVDRLHVVAVDCPSGVDCDTGEAAPETIPAELTVCMEAVKRGLLMWPAFELVGELQAVVLGLPAEVSDLNAIQSEVISADWVRQRLPKRPAQSHKGTYGTAMLIAGSINYTGAALLAGKSACRVGTGLVQLAVPGPLYGALAGHLPEAVWLILPHETGVIAESAADLVLENLERITALLVGPGLGLEEVTLQFMRRLLGLRESKGPVGFISATPAAGAAKKTQLPPLVVDADGLKLLAKIPDWQKILPQNTVLTPHPGEMSVLTGLSVDEIQSNRIPTARHFADQWGHVIVLKGALTVIASPDGQFGIIPVATSALAHAGTGDVLAGLITGLLAQGMAPFEAAAAGAWIHAQAGVYAANQMGNTASVIASDVCDSISQILRTR
jgi:NAD(P)H-hydrate epimerase